MHQCDLSIFNNDDFIRGRCKLIEFIWLVFQAVFIDSWIPGSKYRIFFLRLFGAKIGKGVCIKPKVKIKFPWRLEIGDHSWIGEKVWIDNLGKIVIGNNCCISQGVYLCTGSHNWSSKKFDLITRSIIIMDCAWIGAFSTVAPGSVIKEGAVLCLASTAIGELGSWSIFQGNPAKKIGERHIE